MGAINVKLTGRKAARARPAFGTRMRHWLERMGAALLDWHNRQQQRRALMQLDDRMLRDIGVSRGDAENEAAKPFWRP